jgi:hypothetical protein
MESGRHSRCVGLLEGFVLLIALLVPSSIQIHENLFPYPPIAWVYIRLHGHDDTYPVFANHDESESLRVKILRRFLETPLPPLTVSRRNRPTRHRTSKKSIQFIDPRTPRVVDAKLSAPKHIPQEGMPLDVTRHQGKI